MMIGVSKMNRAIRSIVAVLKILWKQPIGYQPKINYHTEQFDQGLEYNGNHSKIK